MSRRVRRSLQNLGRELGRSGRRCRSWCLPTLETAQPEVGSSGWKMVSKSTARRVVSGVFRWPLKIWRAECRSRPVVLITASGLQGKGSQQNGSITLGKGLALRAGVPVPNPSTVGGMLEL
ncbi:unnamed protein product, partial [Brassica napus]